MDVNGTEPFGRLSPRQRECLRLVYDRKRTGEIASVLGIAQGTANSYITEAIRLLGARDRIDAAQRLHEHELASGVVAEPPPLKLPPQSEGVSPASTEGAADPAAAKPRRPLLFFRFEGLSPNDFGISARILIILLITFGYVAGFGILAFFVRTVSDLVAGFSRP